VEFDTLVEDPRRRHSSAAAEVRRAIRPPLSTAHSAETPRRRMSESIPLVVDGVLYMSTGIVASSR